MVGSRAFDSVGVTAFEPLDAPLLIDSYPLEQKVLGSDVVEPMLGALDQIGLAGIGMIPGPLRKPLGTAGPLLAPADFHGLSIGVQQSRIASETMKALGGDPHWFAVEGDASGFDAIDSQVSAIQGNGYDAKGSSLTTNVNLWPRPMVVFAGAKLLASLSADEQHVLREAATSTWRRSSAFVQTGEQEHARISVAAATRGFVVATDAQLAALRDAVRPVYDLIGAGAGNSDAIATIESLKRAVAAAPDGLETCVDRACRRGRFADPARRSVAVQELDRRGGGAGRSQPGARELRHVRLRVRPRSLRLHAGRGQRVHVGLRLLRRGRQAAVGDLRGRWRHRAHQRLQQARRALRLRLEHLQATRCT